MEQQRRHKRCYVYLRVSSIGQIEGDGFERQLIAVRKYARTQVLGDLVSIFMGHLARGAVGVTIASALLLFPSLRASRIPSFQASGLPGAALRVYIW